MRALKLTIAYDGTDYCGWQVQAGDKSIQQALEASWFKVTGEQIRITASGRTDGGVHAEAQVCSLNTQSSLDTRSLVRALNAESPFDIAVLKVEEVEAGFHAIRDATGKTYRYQIQYGRIRDPLRRRYWWHVPRELDVRAMNSGAQFLIGTHDFASFQSAGAERASTIRTVTRLELQSGNEAPSDNVQDVGKFSDRHSQDHEHRHRGGEVSFFPTVIISISADGFLYKMVRNIVGSLVRVGEGKESPDWIQWVLDQNDRRAAGQAAPAHGLFLQEVKYSPRENV